MQSRLRSIRLVVVLVCSIVAVTAHAAAVRTFVSATGSDSNTATTCGRAAPCRNFSAALSVTVAGGEIVALDSAGYGNVAIGQSVTLTSVPGEFAYINVSAVTNGITINAGASDVVVLRSLQISGANSSASTGVRLNSGNLSIENCRFSQLTDGAVLAGPASSNVTITNSAFVANVNHGLYVSGGAVNVQDSTFVNNGAAIQADGQGPDQDATTVTPRLTVIRVSGGLVSNNSAAFAMNNPGTSGTRTPGSCNAQNIFLRNDTNIVGNATFLSLTGSYDANLGCTFPQNATLGAYNVQNQNGTFVANQ